MARKMKLIAAVSVVLTIVCALLSQNQTESIAFSMAITFGTIAYHFLMRLIVGTIINAIYHNRMNEQRAWFRVSETEYRVYQKLKVKTWKRNMPTYDPMCFDKSLHSWEELVQAMCQAEVVHEIIGVLSFLPILAAIPFGATGVFVITSVLSAFFDSLFVMMQRYNRNRITQMITDRTIRREKASKDQGNTSFAQ